MGKRRTKWRYVERDEDAPIYEGCVRYNPAARKMWPNWPERHNRYQHFRKHLFKTDGTCRRCGITRARIEEMKDEGRPWEKPLLITPIQEGESS